MILDNKVAIITGGAQGIGASIVRRCVEEGVRVVVFDIDTIALEQLQEHYQDIKVTCCDITDYNQVKAAVNDVYETFGQIDILINNAGLVHNAPLIGFADGQLALYDVKMWRKTMAVNVDAVFYMTVQAAEKMVKKRAKGVVINVSSICAAGNAGQSAYSAAKAGVNALTTTWAKELAVFGIRVAGVAPGFVDTPNALHSMTEEVIAEWKKNTPLKRMATPPEIVEGVIFILKNDFMTGRIVEIDGGLRI